MNELELKLCDIQGRLFELSADKNIPSCFFIKTFMHSDTAKSLDSAYNRAQWAGEEYLLDEVMSGVEAQKPEECEVFSKDVLYWIGYIYRYWHIITDESSAKIAKTAPVERMKRNYMIFHTMEPELAIIKLKEMK